MGTGTNTALVGLTRHQWMIRAASFVLCAAVCTASLSFAQPSGRDCTQCVQCLDELQRCQEKRENLRQGIVAGGAIIVAGAAATLASGGLGSFVVGVGVGIAGASWLLLSLTKCTPCNSACLGCDAPLDMIAANW